jgi:hypothetical protein
MNPLLIEEGHMRRRYLLGVLAVLLLVLAVWLVPMALAAAGGSASPQAAPDQAQTAPSGTQCPFLQAHPWLDPHGAGGGTTGTAQEIVYY